jgi:hypothetical protein
MKKIILTALCIAASLIVTACGESSCAAEKAAIEPAAQTISVASPSAAAAGSKQSEVAGPSAAKDLSSEDDFGFVLPSKAVKIDLKKADPTNEYIVFKYDELGRVKSYCYIVNGKKIAVNYTYKEDENSVWVLAFADNIVGADETFELPGSFNKDTGFTEYKGYYFNGYAF